MHQLLADEDFPYPAVKRLREMGIDVITLQNLGLVGIGLEDALVLELGVRLKRSVLTCNRRDFIRLHKKGQSHFGIIVCTRNPDHESLADSIKLILDREQSIENSLLKVYKPN
ncbi:MAG: DUF5615 family PIN-like protein [Bacteroidota bacterium]